MVLDDTKIEAAREEVRRALHAADNGNQAGEDAVVAMAAAGDLLEALKEAVDDLEVTLHWRGEGWECSAEQLLGKARAAIAKATGAA